MTIRVLDASAVLGVFGLVTLALTALIGFEEPNTILMWFAAALILACPLTLLVHLATNSELTPDERRRWVRELTGARAMSAFSDYLSSRNRRATLARRVAETAARRIRLS